MMKIKRLRKGDRIAAFVAVRDAFGDEVDPLSLRLEWLTVSEVYPSAIDTEHDRYEMEHADGTVTEYETKYLVTDIDAVERRLQAIVAQLRKKTKRK